MTERWLSARLDGGSVGPCAIDYAKGPRTPFPDSFRVGDHSFRRNPARDGMTEHANLCYCGTNGHTPVVRATISQV